MKKTYSLTYDHLDNRNMRFPSIDETIQFRLYDDDNELYFTGYMTYNLYDSPDIFLPLDATMNSYGCTRLDCLNPKTKKWETI